MIDGPPVRYQSEDEDSGRWSDFPFRQGDIVISTRSKSGTTWMQMICALLVFQQPDLPAPLWQLSPWLDWLGVPIDEVRSQVAAQSHRRFIKTHTPLDGVPIDALATYIVVGRHPLDMATSLYHQGDNLDRERMSELTGQPLRAPRRRPSLHDWLIDWIHWDGEPRDQLDSLPGVMMHLCDAWARRHQPNVLLVHYADLANDLPGEMRRMATRLDIVVPDEAWPALIEAASFATMKARADDLAPNPNGVLRSNAQFFRRGSSGAGREQLSADEMDHYLARAALLAPPDLLAWLHR